MSFYDFTDKQLENKALELLMQFDNERMYRTKPIDVYAVIEKCLNVPYDWKYLSPDQSILGMTSFSGGLLWVWPQSKYHDGMLPYQIEIEPGTILIDETLTENGNYGRENFTVMHEIFHHVLHKDFFNNSPTGYTYPTTRRTIDGQIIYTNHKIATFERQANYCAAVFLMPPELTCNIYRKLYIEAGYNRDVHGFVDNTIKEMANKFNVSKQAMTIRLQTLGMIDGNKENLLKWENKCFNL